VRRRDLLLGAVLASLATAAAVGVPLAYGNVVNGACAHPFITLGRAGMYMSFAGCIDTTPA